MSKVSKMAKKSKVALTDLEIRPTEKGAPSAKLWSMGMIVLNSESS